MVHVHAHAVEMMYYCVNMFRSHSNENARQRIARRYKDTLAQLQPFLSQARKWPTYSKINLHIIQW